MNNARIILASASPRRRFLLQQIGLKFEVYPADIGETLSPDADPAAAVESLSLEKARHIADSGRLDDATNNETNRNRATDSTNKTLIIGADTIVVRDGEILGKPSTPAHAANMLASLSGRTHQVYTGVALLVLDNRYRAEYDNGDKSMICQVFHECTDVTFGPLSEQEILAYVDGGSPMDKAGAYGIQDDLGALFVQRIEGDYYNVVGFPLYRFHREVNKLAPGIVTPFKPTQTAEQDTDVI